MGEGYGYSGLGYKALGDGRKYSRRWYDVSVFKYKIVESRDKADVSGDKFLVSENKPRYIRF
ncbi:hypothetical protein FACS1894172_18100 [Spirochaetia bacterium]|nr:hypothetical protein FACS1894172_18100 [Spirochaetia bacterium]